MIGLRPLVSSFGTKFSLLRAACRIAWRYALLMEISSAASQTYRFSDTSANNSLRQHVKNWQKSVGFSTRLRNVLRPLVTRKDLPEEKIADLASGLEVNQIQQQLVDVMPRLKRQFVVLIDKLDEGFEPDSIGIALSDGLVLAAIEVNDRIPECQTTLFVRDNIMRAIAEADPDYSRNIEGQALRLHWDEALLFNVTCDRLRRAFGLDIGGNVKVWNRCTGPNLHGMEGFRKVLRLTLYRPRDVLALLNQAFYRAVGENRRHVVLDDLESTAQEISKTRLGDLHKEYRSIVPGLAMLTAAFSSRDPQLSGTTASEIVTEATCNAPADRATRQHFEIVDDAYEVLRSLYSVGFLGIKDTTSGAFAFCHDGRPPAAAITERETLLVHPCYWMALGMRRRLLADTETEEIHDEYEIHVDSQTPEIRKRKLSQMIAALSDIPVGLEGAAQFEEWCLKAIRILFVGRLTNIELHPNGQSTQRRDIVGTIVDPADIWQRIHTDYGTRQVLFEIKNKKGLEAAEYRQVLSYLVDEYGRCGFIVTRDKSQELIKESTELAWTRELYNKHNRLVVRLSERFLVSLLSKARNPQRPNEADSQLGKVIDNYVRRYIGGEGIDRQRKRRRRRG